jgi:hypothetical protein
MVPGAAIGFSPGAHPFAVGHLDQRNRSRVRVQESSGWVQSRSRPAVAQSRPHAIPDEAARATPSVRMLNRHSSPHSPRIPESDAVGVPKAMAEVGYC